MTKISDFEELLTGVFKCSKDELKDANGPNEIPNWDSISHMEMTSKLEEKFNIELDVDEINQMDSIGKIKEILKKHKIIL